MRVILSFLFVTLYFQGFANKNIHILSVADTAKKHKKEVIFPDPVGVSKLFYIQRDPNPNTLIYELNMNKAGELDSSDPLHVYWIRYAEKGQKEELSYIQRKFAYGVNVKQTKLGEYDVRFAAYKKMPLTLEKGADSKYHIFTKIDKKQAILNRIFVKIEGGSFWIPNIVYAELTGIDLATGKEIIERFKPN